MKGLACFVFQGIPQSPELDGLFLSDMESLGPLLAVMTKLAICSEILWVCAQDCSAELPSAAVPIFPLPRTTAPPFHTWPHVTYSGNMIPRLHPSVGLQRLPALDLG